VKEITQARDSTYLFVNTGPCCAVRIGRSSFTQQEIVDNILSAIDPIVKNLPKKWLGLQAIYLKTPDSVSLPLYNTLPEIHRKISLSAKPEILSGEEEAKKKKKKKKRKRTDDEKTTDEQQQQLLLAKESDRKENKRTKFKLKKIGRKQKKAQQQQEETTKGAKNNMSEQQKKKEKDQTQKAKKAKSISTLLREVANGE